jgi:KDO2-lipid IV(A) lauroyltransferase
VNESDRSSAAGAEEKNTPRGHRAAGQTVRKRWSALFIHGFRLVILYVVLRPIVMLPYGFQLGVGRMLGRVAYALARKPRWIARCNLAVCFPELKAEQRDRLVHRHFDALGMSAIEMAFAWWASERRIRARTDVVGLEHVAAAVASGRGIVMLTAHFTTMELCGVTLSMHVPHIHAVYRRFDKNPIADEMAKAGRMRWAEALIERDNVMEMIRALRAGKLLWFASDQLVRPDKRSVIVPFFGVPCVVHGAIVDMVRTTDALIVPVKPLRLPDSTYRIEIGPALEDFPSDDREADLERLMRLFEGHIRIDPAQYMWIWKRFSKRPPEYPDIYRHEPAGG